MTGAPDRSPTGWLISVIGALVLVVSVFLPFYAVSLTASGIASVQQLQAEEIQRFGNAALQNQLASLHARVGALAGQQLGTITAHQAFSRIGIVLLVVGALGVLIGLLALARGSTSEFDGVGPWLALLGSIAAACVLYRMGVRPIGNAAISLPLREGAWLGLLGSLAILAGGLWPRRPRPAPAPEAAFEDAWSGLSGWTPES